MKRRVIAALLVVAMTASMLLGCGAGETKKEESTSEEKKDGYTIGLAMNTQTNPFFVTVKEGCQKAADEYGIELIVTDAQDDPAIKQKDIENLITKKPDAIIIDTAPTLGALNINALAAADEVIITVNPQLLAMMGLQDFLKTVKKIKSRINDKLDVAGILLTMCDARTNLCKVITEQVSDTFEGQIRIFDSKIPNTVKVGESVYYSEPLLEYAPECKACEAYENLAKELIAYEG